jgi:hypothetical protein
MAEAFHINFRCIAPHVRFDHILFNNVSDIRNLDDETLSSYDFQCIHLPLRLIISDEVINFRKFISGDVADAILERGRDVLAAMLDAALKFNKNHQLLTFVSNFLVPQIPVVASLDEIGSVRDFGEIVRALNRKLVSLIGNYRNVYLADIDSVANSIGKRYVHDASEHCHAPKPGRTSRCLIFRTCTDAIRIKCIARSGGSWNVSIGSFIRSIW